MANQRKQSAELDNEIAKKRDRLNTENGNAIVSGVALPFLKSDECEKVKGQLSYIVQNMKEEQQQSRGYGLHR